MPVADVLDCSDYFSATDDHWDGQIRGCSKASVSGVSLMVWWIVSCTFSIVTSLVAVEDRSASTHFIFWEFALHFFPPCVIGTIFCLSRPGVHRRVFIATGEPLVPLVKTWVCHAIQMVCLGLLVVPCSSNLSIWSVVDVSSTSGHRQSVVWSCIAVAVFVHVLRCISYFVCGSLSRVIQSIADVMVHVCIAPLMVVFVTSQSSARDSFVCSDRSVFQLCDSCGWTATMRHQRWISMILATSLATSWCCAPSSFAESVFLRSPLFISVRHVFSEVALRVTFLFCLILTLLLRTYGTKAAVVGILVACSVGAVACGIFVVIILRTSSKVYLLSTETLTRSDPLAVEVANPAFIYATSRQVRVSDSCTVALCLTSFVGCFVHACLGPHIANSSLSWKVGLSLALIPPLLAFLVVAGVRTVVLLKNPARASQSEPTAREEPSMTSLFSGVPPLQCRPADAPLVPPTAQTEEKNRRHSTVTFVGVEMTSPSPSEVLPQSDSTELGDAARVHMVPPLQAPDANNVPPSDDELLFSARGPERDKQKYLCEKGKPHENEDSSAKKVRKSKERSRPQPRFSDNEQTGDSNTEPMSDPKLERIRSFRSSIGGSRNSSVPTTPKDGRDSEVVDAEVDPPAAVLPWRIPQRTRR